MSHTDIAMAGSLNFVELCWEYSRVMKLLGFFNSFKLEQGVMNAHSYMRSCFLF